MNYVEYPTALKLKDRFPVPIPEFGQVWYYTDAMTFEVKPVLVGSALWNLLDGKDKVYSPTASDILKEIPGAYLAYMIGDCWGCFQVGTSKMIGFNSENPAEACAEAYLSLIS